MMFNILKITGIIAIFQMVLLMLFFNSGKNRNTSNKVLSLILLVYAIQICAIDFITILPVPMLIKYNWFPGFCDNFMFLFGPLIWIYSKSIIGEKINKRVFFHIIPFIVMMAYMSLMKIIDPHYLFMSTAFSSFTSGLILAQCLIYILLTSFSIFKKIDLYKSYFKQSDGVQRLYGFLLTGLILLWVLKFNTFIFIDIWKLQGICPFAASIYFIAGFLFLNILIYLALIKPELFAWKKKYQNNNLTKEKKQYIIEELLKNMEVEKIYTNSSLTLNLLAKKTGVSVHYLSQTINEEFHVSFYEYINGYRIEEAKRLLLTDQSEYTVQQIMYEVGFNSKSAFHNAFKKHAGCTPTEIKHLGYI